MHCPLCWPGYDIHSLLMRIVRSQMHRLHTLASELGLQRGQPAILVRLAQHEGVTQSELAALLGIRPASMTHSLQRLEQAGLIARCDDPSDQRISRVHLTPEGREMIKPLQETMQMLNTQALQGLDQHEIDALTGYLTRIVANLDAVQLDQE